MSERKIDVMHKLFGVTQDKMCEDCSNLIKGKYHGLYLRKCTVYGATHSEASDWRKKYQACWMFNKEWNGNEIIRMRSKRKIPFQVDGQVEMDWTYIEVSE